MLGQIGAELTGHVGGVVDVVWSTDSTHIVSCMFSMKETLIGLIGTRRGRQYGVYMGP